MIHSSHKSIEEYIVYLSTLKVCGHVQTLQCEGT